VKSQHDALIRFAKERLHRGDHLASEATTNTWPVVDVLQPFVAEIVKSNFISEKLLKKCRLECAGAKTKLRGMTVRSSMETLELLPPINQVS